MTHKTQKIISLLVICLAVVGGFQALIYILNLNQPGIYFQVAFWIFVYLLFNIVFFFDLHFKRPGSWKRARLKHRGPIFKLQRALNVVFSALWDRFEHLRKWKYLSQWLHFLLLPGFIFWSTVSLFYVTFGYLKSQETIALLSSLTLVFYYMYIKEIFFRQKEKVDRDIFVVLAVVKIYAAGALYAAALSLLRYNCLSPVYFSLEVFCFTFLLIYQAIYQHRLVTVRNIGWSLAIALAMAAIGYFVYVYWGFNYFTAAVFMTACYNLFWGVFHFYLDRVLTRKAFIEVFVISALIAAMVISVTNFRARILDGCNYSYGAAQTAVV